ncbi:hypothetical protein [Luteimonas fraxinea]|uniref:hypothetical protein n=1 Tax=Luteimonas fraxinea TaxID=2901869 RepID=UPI001E339365|nr:hypothetical protein [Luteimonas fraxinea]MCD9125994.1 hypothetical protein [Luteimonas fraxinea]
MDTACAHQGRFGCVRVNAFRWRKCAFAMLGALLTVCAPSANAQRNQVVALENLERAIKSAEMVSPLKSDLFGDSVSLYNGATEFRVSDIDLAGNNALPVRLSRKLVVDVHHDVSSASSAAAVVQPLGGFGRWDIDVPYIYGTFDSAYGWRYETTTSRCSFTGMPAISSDFAGNDVWNGYRMNLPGDGEQQIVVLEAHHARPTDGRDYKWGTRALHRGRCIPTVHGMAGEGFEFVDTSGVVYRFDVAVSRDAGMISKTVSSTGGDTGTIYLHRENIYLMASRVEDRFGNFVNYNYQNGKLASIVSSDGRRIDITYVGDLITQAAADGKIWRYNYQNRLLNEVVLPDNSKWSFEYEGSQQIAFQYVHDDPLACDGILVQAPDFTVAMQHPSGASGRFSFGYALHYMSGTPAQAYCSLQYDSISQTFYRFLGLAPYFYSYSLGSKTISGPGLDPMTWSYSYGWPETFEENYQGAYCDWCDKAKSVYVTDPDGIVTEHRFGALWGFNNGELLGKYVRSPSGQVLRSETYTMVSDAEGASMPFPNTFGIPIGSSDNSSQWNRPVKLTKIAIDGDVAGPVYWTAPPPPPPPPPPPCEVDCFPPPPICDPMTGICQDPMSQRAAASANGARMLRGQIQQQSMSISSTSPPNVYINQVEAFDSLAFPVQSKKWSQTGE